MLEVNLKSRAVTQTSKAYNSACRFGSLLLGATAEGLFKLTGQTDNDHQINAFCKTLTTDLALTNPKRLRHLVLSYKSTEKLLIEAFIDDESIGVYEAPAHPSTITRIRVKLGQGAKGTHLAFKFANINGGSFIIYSATLFFEVLENFTTKEGL